MQLRKERDMRQRGSPPPVEQPNTVGILAAVTLLVIACAAVVRLLSGQPSPALLSIVALIVAAAARAMRR